MKKLFKTLLVLIPAFLFFSPTQDIFVNNLCAQTTRPGIKCIEQRTDCSGFPGYEVASEFFDGVSAVNMDKDDLREAFNTTYPNGVNSMCISSNFSTIIPVYTATAKADDGNYNIAPLPEPGALDTVRVPRACPPGWRADQGNYTFSILGIGLTRWTAPYGCCPSGYNFINTKNQTFPDAYQVGVCAKPTINGRAPDHLVTEGGNRGIYAQDGTLLVGFDASASYEQFPSWDALNAAIGTADYIYSYRSSTVNDVVQPQIGQGLGTFFQDTILDGSIQPRLRTGPTIQGAKSVCPASAACAITAKDNLDAISSSEFTTNASLNCEACYRVGDAIGYSQAPAGATDDPSTPVDESKGFVRYCVGGASVYRDETLIGSPEITGGYLLEEGQNQELYEQCFESGGIYTAIGCVDPSPTGIITGLVRIALGIMGGVALLQMVYVGLLYQQGQTEKIKGARSQLIATLTGIAVLVFSVLILRIIGVNILDVIPNGTF